MKFLIKTAVMLSVLASFSAMAAEKIVFKSEVFQEVTVKEAGKEVSKLIPADKIVPGGEVIYLLSFSNEGDADAKGIVINNPIPANTWYREGSAFGAGSEVLVSINDGQSFGQLSELTVKLADGVERPATFKDVTHVRWALNYALQPGKTGTVSYRAVVQ